MNRRSLLLLAALGAGVVAALAVWVVMHRTLAPGSAPPRTAAPTTTTSPMSTDNAATPSAAMDPERIAAAAAEAPRYPVDLEWLRARLPTNAYWENDAPTSDPEVAKQRAERAERANVAYGRVLSGEASEQEIRDYYAHRRKISEDYLELSRVVLAEKGAELPERDRGLFELSAQMHRDRLAQIERDMRDALARKATPR